MLETITLTVGTLCVPIAIGGLAVLAWRYDVRKVDAAHATRDYQRDGVEKLIGGRETITVDFETDPSAIVVNNGHGVWLMPSEALILNNPYMNETVADDNGVRVGRDEFEADFGGDRWERYLGGERNGSQIVEKSDKKS